MNCSSQPTPRVNDVSRFEANRRVEIILCMSLNKRLHLKAFVELEDDKLTLKVNLHRQHLNGESMASTTQPKHIHQRSGREPTPLRSAFILHQQFFFSIQFVSDKNKKTYFLGHGFKACTGKQTKTSSN